MAEKSNDTPKRFEIKRAWVDLEGGESEALADMVLGSGDIRCQYGTDTVKYRFCQIAEINDSLSLSEGPTYARLRTTITRIA